MCISFDPEILIPEIVPTEIATHRHKNIDTDTLIAALYKGGKAYVSISKWIVKKKDDPSIFWNVIQCLRKMKLIYMCWYIEIVNMCKSFKKIKFLNTVATRIC